MRIIIIFYICAGISFASSFKGDFITGRSLALVSAYNSVLSDSSYEALYFLPAALVYQEEKEKLKFCISYSLPLFNLDAGNLKSYYLAISKELAPNLKGGLLLNSFISNSLYREFIFGLSGATKLSEDLGVGIIILRYSYTYSLDEYTRRDPVFMEDSGRAAMSFGISAAYHKEIKNQIIAFDILAKNINKPEIGLKDEEELPIFISFSVGYKKKGEPYLLIGGINLEDLKEKKQYLYICGEYELKRVPLVIRGGISSSLLGFGATLVLSDKFKLDYGLQIPYLIPLKLFSSSLSIKFFL